MPFHHVRTRRQLLSVRPACEALKLESRRPECGSAGVPGSALVCFQERARGPAGGAVPLCWLRVMTSVARFAVAEGASSAVHSLISLFDSLHLTWHTESDPLTVPEKRLLFHRQ